MMMIFKDQKQAYSVAIAVGAVLAELIYVFYVPNWVKGMFGPVPMEETPFTPQQMHRHQHNVQSMGFVFENLEKLVGKDKGKTPGTGIGIPRHRLQLALATYLVEVHQDQWEDKEEAAAAVVGVGEDANQTQVNVTELEELRDRFSLADWAYLGSTVELDKRLQKRGYVLLRQDVEVAKGDLGHYLAFHPDEKEFGINIQGIPAIPDLLKNHIVGKTKDFKLPNNPYTGENATYTIHVPKGTMNAALHILEQVKPILEHLIIPTDYQIAVQGHSLGGGCAALLGIALRAHLPEHRERIQVYAFGPTAVLDPNNANASASFVTSVVNRADMVPRTSPRSIKVLKETLLNIDKRLRQWRLTPKDTTTTMLLIRKMLTAETSSLFGSMEELEAMKQKAIHKVDGKEGEFVVPGRVVVLYGKETDPSYTATGSFLAVNATASHSKLKFMELSKTLFWDHTRDAYKRSLGEAIGDQSTSSKTKKPQLPRRKRLSNYFKKHAKLWFRPTTRLDSPFAALVIVALLALRMIAESLPSNPDDKRAPDEKQKKKATTSSPIKPNPVKQY